MSNSVSSCSNKLDLQEFFHMRLDLYSEKGENKIDSIQFRKMSSVNCI